MVNRTKTDNVWRSADWFAKSIY